MSRESNSFSIFKEDREEPEASEASKASEASDELHKIKFFCHEMNITFKSLEELEQWLELQEGRTFEEKLSELALSIGETPIEKSTRMKKERELIEHQKQEKQKLADEMEKITSQIKNLKAQLEKLEISAEENQKKMKQINRKPCDPPSKKMEVIDIFKKYQEKNMPKHFECDASPEVFDFLKECGFSMKRQPKKGIPIQIDFADPERPFQHDPVHVEKSDFFLPKHESSPIGDPSIVQTIKECLDKNKQFFSIVRGLFLSSTVSLLPYDTYGVLVTQTEDGFHSHMYSEQQSLKDSLTLYCGVISKSADTIAKFVTDLENNMLNQRSYGLLQNNLQKRE